jgi:alanyl aminopeptidase
VHAQLVKTDDAELRGRLLGVLVSPEKPELAQVVRDLAFDPALRATEMSSPVWAQIERHETREATWSWVKANFDKLLGVMPQHHSTSQLIEMAQTFCDEAHAKDVESFFTPDRIERIDGGPRVLAGTLEEIRLCTAKRQKQEPSARELFGKGGASGKGGKAAR